MRPVGVRARAVGRRRGAPEMLGSHWLRCLAVALIPLATACGPSLRSQTPVATPARGAAVRAVPEAKVPPAPVEPLTIVEDPVVTLIATAERHFRAGQKELEQGHVEAARQEFDRAVDLLLESPYGARTEPRIREHFDRLVDRISTYEVRALAAGDGFTEKKYEPATIDELLALSTTIGTPAATPELKDVVTSDLQNANHDIPIPLN